MDPLYRTTLVYYQVFVNGFHERCRSIALKRGAGPRKRLKHFLACTAYRAFPIFRKILKPGSLGYLPFSVSLVGVVYISAVDRLALVHLFGICHAFSFYFSVIIPVMFSRICSRSFTINSKDGSRGSARSQTPVLTPGISGRSIFLSMRMMISGRYS